VPLVLDGDTLVMAGVKIRLDGIDASEMDQAGKAMATSIAGSFWVIRETPDTRPGRAKSGKSNPHEQPIRQSGRKAPPASALPGGLDLSARLDTRQLGGMACLSSCPASQGSWRGCSLKSIF
jgi:hypothetical protein